MDDSFQSQVVHQACVRWTVEQAISIRNVSKIVSGIKLLDRVDLYVPAGQIVGIVGQRSSGKNTLFQAIAGFANVNIGEIRVWGKVVGKANVYPDDTGFLMDFQGFLPQISGFRNLMILADIEGKATRQQIIDAMRMVGLDPDLKRPYSKYTLPMKQKLSLAQALMEEPKLLLLDEPMKNLDEQSAEKIRSLLLYLNQTKKVTILLTSRSNDDIRDMCSSLYNMQDGVLLPPKLSS